MLNGCVLLICVCDIMGTPCVVHPLIIMGTALKVNVRMVDEMHSKDCLSQVQFVQRGDQEIAAN